jgi:polyferredoxin
MTAHYPDLSLTRHSTGLRAGQKAGLLLSAFGMLILLLATMNVLPAAWYWLPGALTALAGGSLLYAWQTYAKQAPGIQNNGIRHRSISNRGLIAWLLAAILTGIYVLLYWFPGTLGLATSGAVNTGLIGIFDPLSILMNGKPASQWFVYGAMYTLLILIMGFRFILKFRHNRYQILRTLSVVFFQLCFAFILPEWMARMQLPYYDLKNMWPLNYSFFFDWNIQALLKHGTLGYFLLGWGLALMFIISPILTYFFGKRWYCSWVCGCGGLAETAGDPFRHLSDKSSRAWQWERWLIHLVLVFVTLMTIAVLYTFFSKHPDTLIYRGIFVGFITVGALSGMGWLIIARHSRFRSMEKTAYRTALIVLAIIAILPALAHISQQAELIPFLPGAQLKQWYGFIIGAAFSGVIGVGFYPIMGSRVWCRFGCPMAAILGLQQRFFSRFRISTNGGQCISCGNCSTFCEMGIDVRAYAQEGKNIVRASCVGCGICAAVCPRGVLRLESSPQTATPGLRFEHGQVSLNND